MGNPWLDININDYVNHMSSPEVGQYQLINECFRSILIKYQPKRIFVPGSTIGNGFEYIKWNEVEKVTALDVNPDYLKVLKNKFPAEDKLEIINEDFQFFNTHNKYDLIFAALFLEYVDSVSALRKFKNMMVRSSILYSMIQLPDENQGKVSKTNCKSLEKLSPYIKLITENQFETEIKNAGLKITFNDKKTLKNGKSFFLTESSINHVE